MGSVPPPVGFWQSHRSRPATWVSLQLQTWAALQRGMAAAAQAQLGRPDGHCEGVG
jgi:hypothetical protein